MIWCVESGTGLMTYKGHECKVYCLAWSPDSKLVASGGESKNLRVWKADHGSQVVEPLVGHTDSVLSVSFGAKIGALFTASSDKSVIVWDVPKYGKATVLRRLTGHVDEVRCVSVSPGDVYVASASDDKTVRLWDVGTGHVLRVLEGHLDWVSLCV